MTEKRGSAGLAAYSNILNLTLTGMNGQLRSKSGCWTCRLRKKKCDEGRPQCTTCKSLCITCYEYGPKPEWMDNGPREKAVADGIKQIVKVTSRKKPNGRASDNDKNKALAPMISRVSHASDSGSGAGMQFTSLPPQESTLVMHFLDKVIPLQYPAYKSHAFFGGRGWLLHLLLHTKPLYHAALALGAYHMLMDGFTALNTLCRAFAEVRREEQLEISLKEVQRTANEVLVFTKKNQRANALGLVASVVQLVFFELFAGESCAWKVHLDAAIDMYAKGRRDGLANYNLNQKSKKLLYEDSVLGDFTVEDDGPTIVHEVVTFRFVGATVIWLDLISSITAGTSPRLLQYHPGAFREESQVKFEDVVGCPNAVALEMGRIAYMHDQITQEQEQGLLAGSNNKYRDEAARIYRSLETFMQTIRTTSMIPFTSRIFAYASLVYLHLVTDGFKETDRLGYVVCAAIQDIQKEGYGQAITAVICPLFIIGCIARQGEEQQLFRGLLSSRPITGHLPKHRDRILPILEEIWSRKGLPSFVWNDVIRMTTGVLLV